MEVIQKDLIGKDFVESMARRGESYFVEFKKSTARIKSACETICAFLNGDGGVVLFGVADDGRLVGQDVTDKTKREIGNELSKVSPVVSIEVEYLLLSNVNKYIIVVRVLSEAINKPYSYDGRAYLRNQSNTIRMPSDYYQQLVLYNVSKKKAWEDQLALGVAIDDLDIDLILATLRNGAIHGRIPKDFSTTDPWKALQHLGLIDNDKITNAAVILFGKRPERWCPQVVVKLARFRGVDKSEFIDNKRIAGNAFELLQGVLTFAHIHLPVSSTFSDSSIERKDAPLFPALVLREAVANAICHRDYASRSGSISLAIFDDRVEIWSYGLLPSGVTVESLKKINQSIPRNIRIANVFYYHKITETWGRGVNLIFKLCLDVGHPEPQYSQVAGGTLLTLRSCQQIGNTAVKDVVSRLTERQASIVAALRKFGPLSTAVLQEREGANIPLRTIRFELARLKKLGVVEVKGQTSNRVWRVR